MDVWARAQTPEQAAAGFAELGDALVEARESYQHTREYDEALFRPRLLRRMTNVTDLSFVLRLSEALTELRAPGIGSPNPTSDIRDLHD